MSSAEKGSGGLLMRIEPLLVFLVFYLPGYLSESQHLSGRAFNNVAFNLTYLVNALPRIALLLYIIVIRSRSGAPPAAELQRYGIARLKGRDIAWVVMTLLTIELLIIPLSLLGGLLARHGLASTINPVHWKLTNPLIIPLVFVTSMTAGYSEELYFRSYLLTILPDSGIPTGAAVVASTVLFSLGHLYEGALGVVGTLLIGSLLALVFLRRRNIHVIALAHGLYNFITLLTTLSG